MNDQQAGALQRILEVRHPDLAVTATPTEGGVVVTMTGPAATSASAAVGDVTLILGDDSPYLWRLLVGNAQPRSGQRSAFAAHRRRRLAKQRLIDFRYRGYPGLMAAPRIRVTLVIIDVLDVIMGAPQDDPAWGLRICEATGHGPGTVYPALDRLMKAGWIEDRWEEPVPADRPPRRFYTITSAGRAGYAADQERRSSRGLTWGSPGSARGVA